MKKILLLLAILVMSNKLMAVPVYNTSAGAAKSIGVNNTTLSWAHTVAANSKLFVYVQLNGTHTVTAVAHGGISLSQISTTTSGNSKLYIYYTGSPFAGAANVTVTCSARGDTVGQSVSYTGVLAIWTPVTFVNASAKSCTIAVTVQFPNSWIAGSGGVNAVVTYTIPSGGGTHRLNTGAAGVTISALVADKVATPGAFSWIYHQGTTARIILGSAVELFGGTATPTNTRTITSTPTYTRTPTFTITQTATYTITPTVSISPTFTGTATRTISQSPTFTGTSTRTLTGTPTHTQTSTFTVTPTYTITATSSMSNTPTFTVTATSSVSGTPTFTVTPTPTFTITPTFTVTATITPTVTISINILPEDVIEQITDFQYTLISDVKKNNNVLFPNLGNNITVLNLKYGIDYAGEATATTYMRVPQKYDYSFQYFLTPAAVIIMDKIQLPTPTLTPVQ